MGISSSVSSSSSATTSTDKYDVFISFRGEDTRNCFTSHLYEALSRKQITTFIDYRLQKGDEVWPNLSKNIRESRISVVIFSKNYASSKWCLRELVEIMECKEKHGQTVIPVFYQVDPSHVRKQKGSFEDCFVEHEKLLQEEVPKCRKALTEASNLTGWDSSVTKPEAKLVEEVVKDIEKKLTSRDKWSPSDPTKFVGLEERIELVMSLLCLHKTNDIRTIGIWGMGGLGKTTIANEIYKRISYQFEGKCFIKDVRGRLEQSGGSVLSLQQEFLTKVLPDQGNLKLDGINFSENIKKRLSKIKVFIVLDDVDDFIKLETLAGELDQFGSGSRIMITSRDKQVLTNCTVNVHNIHKVEGLNDPEALKLFCKFAFKKDHPTDDLKVLSTEIARYAKGNPLALKVLGSSMFGKNKVKWESAKANLQENLKGQIFDVLKISYDGLDNEEKNMFLDIACFFKGGYKMDVRGIYGDSCYDLLGILEEKSLITVLSSGQIDMHDLLQEMGREIDRRESKSNWPGDRRRLWRQEDILNTLKNGDGTEKVRGIVLCMNMMVEDINLGPRTFENMKGLKFLKFWMRYYSGYGSWYKLLCPDVLTYLSNELRSLIWLKCPLKKLPSNFIPNYNLIELDLSYSNLKTLVEDIMVVPKLKWLILQGCQHLSRISKRLHAPLLMKINLAHCIELLDFPSPDESSLKQLCELDLTWCQKLKNLPSTIHFESLVSLHLTCSNLLTLQEDIMFVPKLMCLTLYKCEHLTSISKRLHAPLLEKIDIRNCEELLDLPSPDEHSLKQLRMFIIEGCRKLKQLPSIYFEPLVSLSVSYNNLETLQEDTLFIPKLESLILKGCQHLTSISKHLHAPLLEKIDIRDCKELLDFPSVDEHCLKQFRELNLQDCKKLKQLPSQIHCESLKALNLGGCIKLTSVSDLSKASLLEDLNLKDCVSLSAFSLPAQHLQEFGMLSASTCTNITSIPGEVHFRSLESFYLQGCNNLTMFPQFSGNIKILNMSGTTIDVVPLSIQNLTMLLELNLSKCTRLEHISTGICKLKSLERLILRDCSKLESFPDILERMEFMEFLDLSGTAIKTLSNSIRNMSGLLKLNLRKCKNLETLPHSICSLMFLGYLDLSNCSNLKILWEKLANLGLSLINSSANRTTTRQLSNAMTRMDNPGSLRDCSLLESSKGFMYLDNCNMLQSLIDLPSTINFLSAVDCKQLRSIPDAHKFVALDRAKFIFTNCLNLEETIVRNILERVIEENKQKYFRISIFCPGGEIPSLFNYQSEKPWIQVQTKWGDFKKNKLVGFAICTVIEFKEYHFKAKQAPLKVLYGCRYNDGEENSPNTIMGAFEDSITIVSRVETLIDSDHIALSLFSWAAARENANILFKFWLSEESCHCRVKSCGVYPIYRKRSITLPRQIRKFHSKKIKK